MKHISILLIIAVLLTWCAPAYAGEGGQNSDENKTVDLIHNPSPGKSGNNSGSGSTPGQTERGSGGSAGQGSEGEGGQPEERELLLGYSDEYTEKTETVSTKTLYYKWYVQSGPGTMKITESNGPITQVGGAWHAGNAVTAYLSAKGRYNIISEQWGESVTKTTVRTKHDLLIEHIKYNLSEGGNFTHTSEIIRKPIEIAPPKVTEKSTGPYRMSKQPHPIYMPEPGPVRIPGKNLATTITVTFGRGYAYTERCIDAYTKKPFELELIFDLEANTPILSIGKPTQLITRYQNQGTMTVSPIAFQMMEGKEGDTHIRYWAKFRYPKASIPGGSPMSFPITVQTAEGPYDLGLNIDVPVNTYNARFTDLPDSERGEFYPIENLLQKSSFSFVTDPNADQWGYFEWPVEIVKPQIIMP